MQKWFYSLLLFINFFAGINGAEQVHTDLIENITLLEMQKYQAEFDALYFDTKYCKNGEDFEKLRHIFLHLTKTIGKMATYCEMQEHGKQGNIDELTDAVLPDLYLHALQLANLLGVDLIAKYRERIEFLVKRNQSQN